MDNVYVPETLPATVAKTAAEGDYWLRVLVLLLLACFVSLSVYRLSPPDGLPATAPATEFSSARALRHVESIARNPHPVGSAEHALVRSYILKELEAVGLAPEVQETTAVNRVGGGLIAAGSVSDVMARLKGTGDGSAVMLTAHYDSVPTGPGASDDASSVAALLETARALKAGPPLKNDVIFLFTDGEEVGLLGARAFVEENPAARDVRLALNFEARGNSGAAMMFETSPGNGGLIREFAAASPRPAASSLSYEIYKRMPNDTDLSVFKEAGWGGMNFAFIKGLARYHTQADSIENLDERTLQHQGTYALSLARHFGNLDLGHLKAGDDVYFDVLSLGVIRYPVAWVLPLAALAGLLFVGVLAFGLRRKHLTFSGLTVGFFSILLSAVASAVAVTGVWWLTLALNGSYRHIPQGDTYNSYLYQLSFVALTAAVGAALYALFLKKRGWQNLLAGGLVWWALLMVVSSLFLPGASYLLTWPLLAMLPALVYAFASPARQTLAGKAAVLLAACALPGVVLIAPSVYTLLTALPLSTAGAVMLLPVLLLVLLLPSLGFVAARRRWLPSVVAAGVCLLCLVAGGFTGGVDKKHPEPSDLFYGLNADTGKAFWGSADSPDAWTTQFLTARPERGPLAEFFPLSRRPFLRAQAPSVALDAPQVALLDSSTEGDVRTLRLRITSPRKAPFLSIQTDAETEILGALVNGKKVPAERQAAAPAGRAGGWSLRYYGLPEGGVEVSLQAKSSRPVRLQVVDQTYGLPAALTASHPERPDYMMPAPFGFSPYSDSTLVGKSFAF